MKKRVFINRTGEFEIRRTTVPGTNGVLRGRVVAGKAMPVPMPEYRKPKLPRDAEAVRP